MFVILAKVGGERSRTHLCYRNVLYRSTCFCVSKQNAFSGCHTIHRVSEKTVQNCFCQNFVKFLSIL